MLGLRDRDVANPIPEQAWGTAADQEAERSSRRVGRVWVLQFLPEMGPGVLSTAEYRDSVSGVAHSGSQAISSSCTGTVISHL